MAPGTRFIERITRSAHGGIALLRSTVARPAEPLKVNLCLTYRCQSRCKTCGVWRRTPDDELTAGEIAAFVRENPRITWADLTGGEIFLRPDIDEILDAVVGGWKRLALLHFPTNGLATACILRSVRRIAGRMAGRIVVTVSLDGDEETNDEIRGVQGAFRRQLDTFKALRGTRGVTSVLGLTLSSYNVERFAQTLAACAREIPGFAADDVHLNVADLSAHYYGNECDTGIRPDVASARHVLRGYRRLRSWPRSVAHVTEGVYLRYLDGFLRTGVTPVPCHALRASCFVDPGGVVYPCITYSHPIGRLRDTGMSLGPIWDATATRRLQRDIWAGDCPQCWTACEAYQTILGNVLAGRWRRGHGRDEVPVSGCSERAR